MVELIFGLCLAGVVFWILLTPPRKHKRFSKDEIDDHIDRYGW